MNQNYYQILEISQNASKEQIQKSFEKLLIKYHPDNNKDHLENQKFQQIIKAYEVLSNELKKEIYDDALKSFLLDENIISKNLIFETNEPNTINNELISSKITIEKHTEKQDDDSFESILNKELEKKRLISKQNIEQNKEQILLNIEKSKKQNKKKNFLRFFLTLSWSIIWSFIILAILGSNNKH